MHHIDAEGILTSLGQHGVRYVKKRGHVLIVCPFHPDTNPSGHVILHHPSLSPGYFRCFSCGASKSWFNLCQALDIPVEKNSPIDNLSSVIKADKISFRTPTTLCDVTAPWRGISADFLKNKGCKLKYDILSQVYRLHIPVFNGHKTTPIGAVEARLDTTTLPKYRNSDNLSAKTVLLGLTWLNRHSTIILTEGPADALRLQYVGLPAVSILGTQNWSSYKINLLASCGVKRVLLAFDDDPAGNACTEKIYEQICNMFDTRIWTWSNGNDPASAPIEEVEMLKHFVQKLDNAKEYAQ